MTKKKFKPVMLPIEAYEMLKKLADKDNRSLSNYLTNLIYSKNENRTTK